MKSMNGLRPMARKVDQSEPKRRQSRNGWTRYVPYWRDQEDVDKLKMIRRSSYYGGPGE